MVNEQPVAESLPGVDRGGEKSKVNLLEGFLLHELQDM